MNIMLSFARYLKRVISLRDYAAAADYFLISYPKSGRTWLRFLVSYYIASLKGAHVPVDLISMFTVLPNFDRDLIRGIPAFRYATAIEVPKIWVSHLSFDRRLFLDRPVIMIVRDPRDVIVSAYFHATRHKHRFQDDIHSFIRDEVQGVPDMCRYLNGWAKGLAGRHACVVTYEAMSADPESELARVLTFVGLPLDQRLVADTVAAGNFNAMQALERVQGIPGHDYDRSDTESLRMRQGKSGGYAAYLDNQALIALKEICASKLSDAAKTLIRKTQYDV